MVAVIGLTDLILTLGIASLAGLIVGQTIFRRRLNTIERQLDAVLAASGVDWDEFPRRELSRQVKALADNGERQLAVELHQQQSGLTLDDAQVAVEAYMRGELPESAIAPELAIRRSA